MAGEEQLPLTDINEPYDNDVLCGRGGAALRHPGNLTYRRLVNLNKGLYITCLKTEKLKISRSIVAAIREQKGRFLEKDSSKGTWYDIGDKKAIEKTSQALREGQPRLRQQIVEMGGGSAGAAAVMESQYGHQGMYPADQLGLVADPNLMMPGQHSTHAQSLRPQEYQQMPPPMHPHVDFPQDMLQRLSLTDVSSNHEDTYLFQRRMNPNLMPRGSSSHYDLNIPSQHSYLSEFSAFSSGQFPLNESSIMSFGDSYRRSLGGSSNHTATSHMSTLEAAIMEAQAKSLFVSQNMQQVNSLSMQQVNSQNMQQVSSLSMQQGNSRNMQQVSSQSMQQGNSQNMQQVSSQSMQQGNSRNMQQGNSQSMPEGNPVSGLSNNSNSQEANGSNAAATLTPTSNVARHTGDTEISESSNNNSNNAATSNGSNATINNSKVGSMDRRRMFAKMKYNKPPSGRTRMGAQSVASQRSLGDGMPDIHMVESTLSIYSNLSNVSDHKQDSKPMVETVKVKDHSSHAGLEGLGSGSRHSIMSGLSRISDASSIDHSIFSDLSRKIGNVSTRSIAMSEISAIDMQERQNRSDSDRTFEYPDNTSPQFCSQATHTDNFDI